VWERDRARATQAKRVKDHADRAEAKRKAAEVATVAARDALLAAYPVLAALLTDEYADPTPFMASLKRALQRGDMSRWQCEKACTAIGEDRARTRARVEREQREAAARVSGVRVPTGRDAVTVKVLSVKPDVTYFGHREQHVLKMTVEHADGWRAYGTAPRGLEPQRQPADGNTPAERDAIAAEWLGWHGRLPGREITMVATFDGPKDAADPLFGYFSRPRLITGVRPGPAARRAAAAHTPVSHAAAPAASPAPVDPWAGLLTAAGV
jgi:hypothetical protein